MSHTRKANGQRVSIYWIPDSKQQSQLTPRVLKSIPYWKARLPNLVTSSGADINAIKEFRTDIFIKPNKQIAVETYLLDDRDKEHVCNVIF